MAFSPVCPPGVRFRLARKLKVIRSLRQSETTSHCLFYCPSPAGGPFLSSSPLFPSSASLIYCLSFFLSFYKVRTYPSSLNPVYNSVLFTTLSLISQSLTDIYPAQYQTNLHNGHSQGMKVLITVKRVCFLASSCHVLNFSRRLVSTASVVLEES